MKRVLSIAAVGAGLLLLVSAAAAQMEGGPWGGRQGGMMGGGMRGMGPGTTGEGTGCHGTEATATQVTEDKAKELAQQYADKYLAGFTVDKVLPFTGMHHTMYSVELKDAAGEVRTLHINPFGNVMPFGPRRQSRS